MRCTATMIDPLTQRELNNTIAGWLTAAAIFSWMSYWQIQIKPWLIWWIVILGSLPVIFFTALYVGVKLETGDRR